MIRPAVSVLATALLLVALTAAPAAADRKPTVPCSGGTPQTEQEYEPRTCAFASEPQGGQFTLTTVKKMDWRNWGGNRAKARGKLRLSDGVRRVDVRLSRLRGGCYDFVRIRGRDFRTGYNLQGCGR